MRAKKLLSLLLVFAMAVSLLPTSVWADVSSDPTIAVADSGAFGTATVGYAAQTPKAITITNADSSNALAIVSVTASDGYEVTIASGKESLNGTELAASGSSNDVYLVAPVTGLAAGTHNGTVTLTYETDKTVTANVTFTVENPVLDKAASITNGTLEVKNGTTDITGDLAASYKSVAPGTVLTITVTPNDGYQVDAVTDGTNSIIPEGTTANASGVLTFSFTMPETAVTITPTFSAKKYTIFFDPGEGTGRVDPIQDVDYGATQADIPAGDDLTPPAGKMFDKWNTQRDGTGTDVAPGDDANNITSDGSTSLITGNITLYAQYANAYTVTFDANGGVFGTAPNTTTTVVERQKKTTTQSEITFPTAPTRTGDTGVTYTFAGWYKDADLTDQVTGTGYTPAEADADENLAITLYAKWTTAYAVTFNGGSASVGGTKAATTASGDYVLPDETGFTWAGHEFEGWKIDGAGNTIAAGKTIKVTAPITLVAQWKEVFTLQFNGNSEDSGSVDSIEVYAGEKAELPLNAFVKSGYVFTGWEDSMTGVLYQPNDEYTPTGDTTFTAQWEATSATDITITFAAGAGAKDADGNNYNAAQQVIVNGGTVSEPAAPKKLGYVFDGWYYDDPTTVATDETKFDFSKPFTLPAAITGAGRTIALEAKWTAAYMVVFDKGDDSATGSMDPVEGFQTGDTYKLPECGFELTGYAFTGWSVGGVDKKVGDTITIASSDVTVTAKWAAGYAVVFDYNVAGVDDETVMIKSGDKVTKPTDPTQEGYKFIAWVTTDPGTDESAPAWTSAVAFDFTTPISGATTINASNTLWAKWQRETYTLRLNANGAEGTYTIAPVPTGTAWTVVDPTVKVGSNQLTYVGYYFAGWRVNSKTSGELLAVDAKYTPTANATLYAQWEKGIAVTFVTGNEKIKIDGQTIQSGEKAVKPADPTWDANHEFVGWYADEAYTTEFDFTKALTEDTTVYAKWHEFYNVTFKPGVSGVSMTNTDTTVDAGAEYTVPDFEGTAPTGKKFVGWTVMVDGKETGVKQAKETMTLTADVTLVAKWVAAYTISFDSNAAAGGSVSGSMKDAPGAVEKPADSGTYVVVIEAGEKYTLPESGFVSTTKAFTGWQVNGYGDTKTPGTEIDVTTDTKLVAQWGAGISVTYNKNYTGATPAAVVIAVAKGDLAKAPEIERDGYRLVGWFTDAALTTEFDFSATPITEAIVLYAKWEKSYTISFNANGGTGTMKDVNEIVGEYKLPACEFTAPEGKEFAGWIVDESAGEAKAVNTTIPVTSDVTLFAKWVDKAEETRTATPESVKAVRAKDGTVTITWDAVDGATKYAVYRMAKGGSWSKIAKVSTTSYTDKDQLNANTKYYYCVKAGDPTMDKVWSVHSVVTKASRIITPLDPMTGVSAAVANGKITVSWTDNGAKYFTVYRYTKDGGWVRLPAAKKLAAGTTSFVDETAVAGTAYKYCVKSYNGTWSLKSNNTKAVKIVATSSMYAY